MERVVGAQREANGRPPYAPQRDELAAIAAAVARGYTGEQLERAVRAAASSPLNREPFRRGIPWILRTDERLGSLIGRSYEPPPPKPLRAMLPPRLTPAECAAAHDAAQLALAFVMELR